MRRRRAVGRAAAVVLLLSALAVLTPGSPVYLPTFFSSAGQYGGHSTRHWVNALRSPDAEARRQAAHALGAIGAEAGETVPALSPLLVEDPDRTVRIEAALALSKMAPASRAAVPELGQALADEEPFVRMNAALALLRLRAEARPAVPALIRALNDDANQTNLGSFSFTIQEIAAQALGRASAGSAEAVPALTAALDDARSEELQLAVVRALGEIGADARPAVPWLQALLDDNSKQVRAAAARALRSIGAGPAETADRTGGQPETLTLPEAERAYLWDIEHHGNLLVAYGFDPLAEALKRADAAALYRLLADDFAGTEPGEARRVRADTGYAQVERLHDAGRPPVTLNRAAFVARLLEFRRVFGDTPPQVKLALMTLSPRRRGQLDGPWEGTAQLRLFGERARGAPAEVTVLLRYELPRPTREALSGPGWLRAAEVLQVHRATAPHYLFAEVARQRGLDPSKLHDNWTAPKRHPTPGGVYVCDFDRDGILDVLVTDITGNILYRGRPDGTFEDVTDRCGLPRQPEENTAAAWVDLDGDGWEDLLLAGRVYRNEEGRRFTDYSRRCNLRLPVDTAAVVVADFDRDGRLDLYATRHGRPGDNSWLSDRSADAKGNYLFRNKGNWQFEDVTRRSGALGGHRSTFTAAWLDANDDGWPDLYVINELGDGVLLVNNGNGTFSEHALADRPADFGTMGVAVGDINNDGHIDIYCGNMYSKAGTRVIGNLAPDAYPPPVLERMRRFVAGSQLHLNRGGLKFEQAGPRMQVAAVGWAYGPCLADLDNDGWLDIYATAGFASRDRAKPDG
jgi:HEAT repeat protein